ncbi:MAG: hypothetical protein ACXVBR_01795 [Flavisolibacter sp.]
MESRVSPSLMNKNAYDHPSHPRRHREAEKKFTSAAVHGHDPAGRPGFSPY